MIGQFIVNGLITGILYSLLAIGFALVYNTTRIFHIAAAGLYVVAAYALWFFYIQFQCPLFASAIISIILTMFLSWGIEMAVYRPLKKRDSSLNVMMIASIGVMTILVNVIALAFGHEAKFVNTAIQRTFDFGNIILTTPQTWQLIVGTSVLVVCVLVLKYTGLGRRIRAISEDEVLYSTLGYNVNKSRNVVFAVSGAFIALASCLSAYDVGMGSDVGMNFLINAMVAMMIGGMGRIAPCIAGGIILGILQSLAVSQIAASWQNAVTFTILLILLFVRPQGIAGYKKRII
ncbi:MAG: branched-chain amino acid ABC transporter permease [Prevotella sp.]|nr:branched-chain amino acid ABC transporter permease [Prevotella sp.]